MRKNKVVGNVSEQSGILGVIKEITRQLCDGELNKEEGQAIIEHRNPFVKMVKSARDNFRIVVDYSKSLAEMISVGNYDWANSDISEKNFPVKGNGHVELNIELIHYDKRMESDDIVRDMESRNLRLITPPELLAFGKAYPDKQRKFPIIALGLVCRCLYNYRYVAYLCSRGSKRGLGLASVIGGWNEDCRFAAVHK